ncbi:MAG: MBL fold metallo-hydrolase [Actinomycetota bacterium]|nr:MBL fold metallo-hydrolase [Actinomycetota bacterium]
MSLAVTVLGSSAIYATPERACSGYLIEAGDKRIWLDAGAGTWRNLLTYIDFDSIDGIFLSHRHPDHTTDVFQCFHARRYGRSEPLSPIPLWAPGETIERLLGFSPELGESFDIEQVGSGETIELGECALSFVKMAHPVETLGARVEFDGAAFAYSSDTGPEADFEALTRGTSLFICEATFQDSDEEWAGHMKASQAGSVAAELEVPRLLLTHLPAGRDLGLSIAEARATSGESEVQLAADGMRLAID